MPSYSPVFSQAFIEYTALTPNTSFDVPTGFTAVIRQITVVQDIGGYGFECYIQNSGAAPGLVIDIAESLGINELHSVQGRWVVPGGGIINAVLSSVGDSVSMYVGGYLLRNVLS